MQVSAVVGDGDEQVDAAARRADGELRLSRVARVLAFSRERQLNLLASSHVLTGSTPALARPWREYRIGWRSRTAVVVCGPRHDPCHR